MNAIFDQYVLASVFVTLAVVIFVLDLRIGVVVIAICAGYYVGRRGER